MSSENNNKIDLSSVNKSKKQSKKLKVPKLANPLKKKPAGPRRDAEGKFTSGSGGLAAFKHFNWKRALPLIIVISLTGGFFVWKSFASTPKYAYQYSAHICKGFNNPKDKPDQNCIDKSAEATIYRTYRIIFDRNPGTEAYKSWTQNMVGGTKDGRMKRHQVARRLLGTAEAKKAPGVEANARYHRTFVGNVYQNVFGSKKDQKGIDYWTKQIEVNKWDRATFVQEFSTNQAIIQKYRTNFAKDKSTSATKTMKIQPVARQEQEKRSASGKWVNADSRNVINKLKSHSNDNRSRKEAAGKIAARADKDISKGSLDAIQKNYINVIQSKLNGFKGKDYKGKIDKNYAYVRGQLEKSIEITRYSPDITHHGIKKEWQIADSYRKEVTRHINNANWLLGETRKSYNTAKKKYEAHQRWLAWMRKVNACNSKPHHKWVGGMDGYCQNNTPKPIAQANPGRGGGSGAPDNGQPTTPAPPPPPSPSQPATRRPVMPGCKNKNYKIVWHGNYASCHAFGRTSAPGRTPDYKGICLNGYYHLYKNSDAKFSNGYPRWQGVICVK